MKRLAWCLALLVPLATDGLAAARAQVSDANSFLYLVKANQLFSAGHKGSL